jgi:hypothetical protein
MKLKIKLEPTIAIVITTTTDDSKFTKEEAKFIYAKKMLEKYKEFCNLIDSDE